MDPLTGAVAVATVVLTNAFEKAGEQVESGTLEQAKKLLQLLKRKTPETALSVEHARQQPENYGDAVLIEKLAAAAKADPEIAEAVWQLAEATNTQLPKIQSNAKLTQKLGLLAQNGSVHIQHF